MLVIKKNIAVIFDCYILSSLHAKTCSAVVSTRTGNFSEDHKEWKHRNTCNLNSSHLILDIVLVNEMNTFLGVSKKFMRPL